MGFEMGISQLKLKEWIDSFNRRDKKRQVTRNAVQFLSLDQVGRNE